MGEQVTVAKLPFCDICQFGDPYTGQKINPPRLAEYDARTNFSSSWANMCPDHWYELGTGRLGTGYGQRLVLEDKTPTVVKGALCDCAYVPGDSGHELHCATRG